MKNSFLHVFANRQLVGTLSRSDVEEDTTLFGYRQGCAPQSAVSLTMPIRVDQYDAMGGLLPVFEMNLPEGALKERLRIQFAKAIPHFDDLDLLGIVGASQIGRLRYSPSDHLNESMPEQDLREILTYQGSADLFAHLLEQFARYSGVSGIQPKVLVRDIEHLDEITHRGATHILKTFDSGQYPELAANEFICTTGAAAAGIATSRVQLSANRRFLVAERFDLTSQGEYLGIEDFCVLEGLRAHGRYDGSYERVAKRITDFVSPKAIGHAREQFALIVAYSCAIGNGDAHLKNFSVLYRHPEDVVELAPAYDIVATLPYIPRDTMALTMEDSKEFPDRSRLIRFVRRVTGKNQHAAAELLDRVAAGVETAIKETALLSKRSPDARPFAELMTHCLHRGLERLTASS